MEGVGRMWEERYAANENEWFFGREPSALARMVVRCWRQVRGDAAARVLDLGSGEGRDAVYFAQQGFLVTAVELSPSGIRKTQRLARESGVVLAGLHCMDLRAFALTPEYDIVFAGSSLSALGPDCLPTLRRIREAAPSGALNAVRVLRGAAPTHPDVPPPYAFDHYELKFEYRGWHLLYYGEDTLWVPHEARHISFADVVAQAPE